MIGLLYSLTVPPARGKRVKGMNESLSHTANPLIKGLHVLHCLNGDCLNWSAVFIRLCVMPARGINFKAESQEG